MPFSVCLAHLICRTAQRREQSEREEEDATYTHTHRHTDKKRPPFKNWKLLKLNSVISCARAPCAASSCRPRPGLPSTLAPPCPSCQSPRHTPPSASLFACRFRHSPLSVNCQLAFDLRQALFRGSPILPDSPNVPLQVHFNGFSVEASSSPRHYSHTLSLSLGVSLSRCLLSN